MQVFIKKDKVLWNHAKALFKHFQILNWGSIKGQLFSTFARWRPTKKIKYHMTSLTRNTKYWLWSPKVSVIDPKTCLLRNTGWEGPYAVTKIPPKDILPNYAREPCHFENYLKLSLFPLSRKKISHSKEISPLIRAGLTIRQTRQSAQGLRRKKGLRKPKWGKRGLQKPKMR